MTTASPASSRLASRESAARPAKITTTARDDGLAAFMRVRTRLFGIAYHMLKSAAEAEDVVQDVWVRWQTADRSVVRDAVAFLATTTTRVALNVLQSAHSCRETSAAGWLREPVDDSAGPELVAERRQELASGMQLLLEKLTPTERAAYILREALDYPYREIAGVLRLGEANARQVVTRARHHLARGRRMSASSFEHRRLLRAFIAAVKSGDVAALEWTLSNRQGDSGGVL